jgi:hypothetical protein
MTKFIELNQDGCKVLVNRGAIQTIMPLDGGRFMFDGFKCGYMKGNTKICLKGIDDVIICRETYEEIKRKIME